jgi:5-methylcytosine-specific restriction protein A
MPTRPKTFRPAGTPEPQERRRQFDKVRTETQEWRKWYCSKRWIERRAYIMGKSPLCVECQKEGRVVAGTDLDHIIPHRGDKVLFWDKANLQVLCHSCHSKKTGKGL